MIALAYFSLIFPVCIQGAYAAPVELNKPVIVKAVIDAARIIGLPSSKAAKVHAKRIQMPDPIVGQFTFTPELVSDRQLFFRTYFQ